MILLEFSLDDYYINHDGFFVSKISADKDGSLGLSAKDVIKSLKYPTNGVTKFFLYTRRNKNDKNGQQIFIDDRERVKSPFLIQSIQLEF